MSISGDVVGPTFIDEKPSRLERMFPDGNGRFGKGTEYHLFNLAANTWQLHYYRYPMQDALELSLNGEIIFSRLTNQLHDMGKLKKEVFEQMNVEYTAVMRR